MPPCRSDSVCNESVPTLVGPSLDFLDLLRPCNSIVRRKVESGNPIDDSLGEAAVTGYQNHAAGCGALNRRQAEALEIARWDDDASCARIFTSERRAEDRSDK